MTDNLVVRWIVILLVAGAAVWALTANDLEQGIDLAGGVSLSYRVDIADLGDIENQEGQDAALDQTVEVISTRINSLGVKSIKIAREGADRILIQAPRLSPEELRQTKQTMTQLGELSFPIGLGSLNSRASGSLRVERVDANGNIVPASWATKPSGEFDEQKADQQRQAALDAAEALRGADGVIPRVVVDAEGNETRPYFDGTAYQLVDGTGAALPIWWYPWAARKAEGKDLSAEQITHRRAHAEALAAARSGEKYDKEKVTGGWVYFPPSFYGPGLAGFSGRDISNVRIGANNLGQRTVNYEVSRERQGDFYDYTKPNIGHPMCLVLNKELWSNPVLNGALSDSVMIEGGAGGFTETEANWLVNCLQSGSLKLRPILDSEEEIGATLGQQAVDRGMLATILGGVLIVVFMLFWYRFGGAIAVLGLGLNLLLLMAVLAFFGATLTLPGIAGIILTIGMSVDASILIFERIREEMAKGKTLVASVQAGFDRAFVTIIDANLTTIITAYILYWQGVGPIRGFAVTLMAGIVCSLFTALFFSRTVFAWGIKAGFIKGLTMARIIPEGLRYDFIGKGKKALICSAIAAIVGVGIFAAIDESKYGLDFTGGTIVRMNASANGLDEAAIKDTLGGLKDDAGNQLFREVEVTTITPTAIGDFTPEAAFEVKVQTKSRIGADEMTKRVHADLAKIFADGAPSAKPAESQEDSGNWVVEFTFANPRNPAEVRDRVSSFQADGGTPYGNARVTRLDATDAETTTGFRIQVDEQALLGQSQLRLTFAEAFQAQLPKTANGSSVDLALAFPKVNFIGPNVVASLKERAAIAIILSLIALVLYIWFRFKELRFGLAAAVAVFHDVLVALGVVVLVNAVGIVHVPLSLSIIAGFLTIIGYSLNDTIVLFDRVRENMGNVKGSYSEVINLSINQTLSRTLLTSITTFIVVAILFVMNYGQESPIEGISFTLMVGVVVGTYSSIFVASPLVIWIHNRMEAKGKKA